MDKQLGEENVLLIAKTSFKNIRTLCGHVVADRRVMVASVGGIVVGAFLGRLESEYADWGMKDMVYI